MPCVSFILKFQKIKQINKIKSNHVRCLQYGAEYAKEYSFRGKISVKIKNVYRKKSIPNFVNNVFLSKIYLTKRSSLVLKYCTNFMKHYKDSRAL